MGREVGRVDAYDEPWDTSLTTQPSEGRQNMKHVIENNYDALVQALTLALTAPTPEKQQRCVDLGEAFAATLSDAEIETAKSAALRSVQQ